MRLPCIVAGWTSMPCIGSLGGLPGNAEKPPARRARMPGTTCAASRMLDAQRQHSITRKASLRGSTLKRELRHLNKSHNIFLNPYKFTLFLLQSGQKSAQHFACKVLGMDLATTYSHRTYRPTTIGAAAFHFRVRNGTGWFHRALVTRGRSWGSHGCCHSIPLPGLWGPGWVVISYLLWVIGEEASHIACSLLLTNNL